MILQIMYGKDQSEFEKDLYKIPNEQINEVRYNGGFATKYYKPYKIPAFYLFKRK